jgi:hypothetical protein
MTTSNASYGNKNGTDLPSEDDLEAKFQSSVQKLHEAHLERIKFLQDENNRTKQTLASQRKQVAYLNILRVIVIIITNLTG